MNTFRPTGVDKPLRLAFLGCGKITRKHSRTIEKAKLPVLRYFASRSLEKANTYNSELRGDGFFGTYESAISSPEVDAVFIATPPSSHLDLALKALDAGKHVIVEKPPFFTLADFDAVATARQKHDCQVIVAENYFYKPLRSAVRAVVQQELLGDMLFININAMKQQHNADWREDAAMSGGGALFEGGIHWVNFLANIGIGVTTVRGIQPHPNGGLERSMQVIFNYENGAVGNLFYSWEVPTLFKGLRISRIFGREGSLTFESNGIFMVVRGRKKRLVFPGFADISGFTGMFTDFTAALRTGTAPKLTFDIARRDVQLIRQAYATAELKQMD